MEIKAVGGCCKKASKNYNNIIEAVNELGLDVEVQLVSDSIEIAKLGVMVSPALIINNKVVSSGVLLKPKDIKKYIEKYLENDN